LLGRAFISAAAAAGRPGVEHAMAILKDELRQTMTQIGSETLKDLSSHLLE